MSHFPSPIKDHVAGVSGFQFTEASNVLSHPDPSSIEFNEADIVLKQGSTWHEGVQAFNSLSHSEQEEETDQGDYYKNEVGGFYPGFSKAALQRFRSMQHREYLLKLRDYEGNIRLIGTKEEPLRFRSDYGSARIGGRKGFSFTFYNNQVERSVIITQWGTLMMIDGEGQLLLLSDDHPDTFTLTADGLLSVSGPNEAGYQINDEGQLLFDINKVSL